MAEDIGVEPDELTGAAATINDTVANAEGVQLEELTGDSEAYGHNGVFESVSQFCTTWQVGTTLLAQRSRSLADAVAEAARTYGEHESSTSSVLDQQSSALPGAPGPSPR